MDERDHIIQTAKALCVKFIAKVEDGRARSVETYNDCQILLELIKAEGDK